jgi:hypothetical protein
MKYAMAFLCVLAALLPQQASACSVCFGDPASPAAQGLAMGVVALLGVVFVVLGGIAAFFIYLARRGPGIQPGTLSETTNSSDTL